MKITHDQLKLKIQEYLGKEITQFTLKGKGACNNAYYIETIDGGRYIVKEEREDKETHEQNSLAVEGRVIQQLGDLGLSVPLPTIAFVSEELKMYGYEYVDGDIMRGIWNSLSEHEKIDICRSLGNFHAEIGKKFTKEMSEAVGIEINNSTGLHPEVVERYEKWSIDSKIPEDFRNLVIQARSIFESTHNDVFFQFIHNDAHHENVLIKDAKISGIIDFGDAEYGEIAKEFSRYIRDYPDYFQHIVSAYEEVSGNKLSYKRLVSNAFVSGFNEIAKDYLKEGEHREATIKAVKKYKDLLAK